MNILSPLTVLLLTSAMVPPAVLADAPASFPSGAITVPMLPPQALNGYPYVVVSAKVNTAGPFLFLLDSGAERNFADTTLPRAASLKIHGGGHINGIGPTREGSLQTEETTLQLGAVSFPGQKFLTSDLSGITTKSGISFSGLLGENIFRQFVVRVDYAHSLLTLTPPVQFHYHGTGVVMPLSFNKAHCPQIEAEVEGVTGKFMIDTGSDATLTLNTPFVGENGFRAKYASVGKTITTAGIGGETKVQIVPALRLRIGGIAITGMPVGLSLAQSGTETDKNTDGAFGGALLSHFVLTFDYSRKQLIFEPPTDASQTSTSKP